MSIKRLSPEEALALNKFSVDEGAWPEFETFPVREGTRLSNSARLRRTEAQKA